MPLDILAFGGATLAVSLAGGLLTEIGPWYRALRKPAFQPPDWLFGPAWTVILTLTAASGVVAWRAAADQAAREQIIALFAVNYLLHFAWSPLFFKFRRPDLALIEVPFLWLSILGLVLGLGQIAPLAGWLNLPYLLWVSFATVLNWAVVRLNRPFGRSV